MSIPKPSSADIVSGSTKLARAGLEGGKLVVAYGKPVLEKSANFTVQTAEWSTANPLLATCAVAGTTGAVVFAATSLVTYTALSSIGFTASGVKAGSVAAAAHSSIGNIASGSAFALGQSAGAGGAGLVVLNGATQVVGAVMGVGSAGLAWVKSKTINA